MNAIYETEKLLSEYLLFHYGGDDDILPYEFGPRGALNFPARCVDDCLDVGLLPAKPCGLDVGCAVGRASFELARRCDNVIGIDFSQHFIRAALDLKKNGHLGFDRIDEGALTTRCLARVPADIDRHRVHFEMGDAMHLHENLSDFDVVLAANLIDRLADPLKFVEQLPRLVRPGGQFILTSPYTWIEEFTPHTKWLGGFMKDGERVDTFSALQTLLEPDFALACTRDLPFLIREHRRKFQWSVAHASVWIRRN